MVTAGGHCADRLGLTGGSATLLKCVPFPGGHYVCYTREDGCYFHHSGVPIMPRAFSVLVCALPLTVCMAQLRMRPRQARLHKARSRIPLTGVIGRATEAADAASAQAAGHDSLLR